MKPASKNRLALLGGPRTVQNSPPELFDWPIITREDERAVLAALRARKMSGTDITQQFEREFAEWQGSRHALGFNNGTIQGNVTALLLEGMRQMDVAKEAIKQYQTKHNTAPVQKKP